MLSGLLARTYLHFAREEQLGKGIRLDFDPGLGKWLATI
jgi:hypothetical protein